MSRTLTDPDHDDVLHFSERVEDPDGDSLTTTVKLDAVDDGGGWTQKDTDASKVSWISYTTTEDTLGDGSSEIVFNFDIDYTGLKDGYKYRFELMADDGFKTVTRKVTMDLVGSP